MISFTFQTRKTQEDKCAGMTLMISFTFQTGKNTWGQMWGETLMIIIIYMFIIKCFMERDLLVVRLGSHYLPYSLKSHNQKDARVRL